MKPTLRILFVLTIFTILFPGCKSYWEYKRENAKGNVTTKQKAYDLFTSQIDSVLASKMKTYPSQTDYVFKNDGYFRATNINEEQAPYLVGTIVKRNRNSFTLQQYPNMLTDAEKLDTKIRFKDSEIALFVNRGASLNVSVPTTTAEMTAEDKMRIEYSKVFSAVSKPGWFDDDAWEETITNFNLDIADSLWVITNVQVKQFKYSVYKSFKGTFSTTPTPIVSIGGSVFQESGGEMNIYEVYIQLAQLTFPSIGPATPGGRKYVKDVEKAEGDNAELKFPTNFKVVEITK
jgi:hypothetical protein